MPVIHALGASSYANKLNNTVQHQSKHNATAGSNGGGDAQKPNRICRDYVQGTCRRNYCRVNSKSYFISFVGNGGRASFFSGPMVYTLSTVSVKSLADPHKPFIVYVRTGCTKIIFIISGHPVCILYTYTFITDFISVFANFSQYPHVSSPDMVVFCHDFQNATCPRIKCKYVYAAALPPPYDICLYEHTKINQTPSRPFTDSYTTASKKKISIANSENSHKIPTTIQSTSYSRPHCRHHLHRRYRNIPNHNVTNVCFTAHIGIVIVAINRISASPVKWRPHNRHPHRTPAICRWPMDVAAIRGQWATTIPVKCCTANKQ